MGWVGSMNRYCVSEYPARDRSLHCERTSFLIGLLPATAAITRRMRMRDSSSVNASCVVSRPPTRRCRISPAATREHCACVLRSQPHGNDVDREFIIQRYKPRCVLIQSIKQLDVSVIARLQNAQIALF